MKTTVKFFSLLIIALAVIGSCDKGLNRVIIKNGDFSIKSVFAGGKTVQKFIYNNSGKIAETQSFYFFNKYSYDNNNRLIKQDVAVDPDIYSSKMHIKSELMTSQNSTFTNYYIFEYNSAGKLVTQKNYFKKEDKFEYTSKITLEYDGANIVKRNIHDATNSITQFYTYEYDSKGNVIREKYFSFLFITGSEPKLIRETSFKYDDKNNPFKIFQDLGTPGIYTNTNNIVETSSVLHENVPGVDKYSTSTTTYEYNDKGFPTMVNQSEEYIYD
ncbi:MAG: hypothetical protein CVU12_10375 [Bacteroidetes bacterium HGW-Bacteroidetes-7]|jgi:hypothetical protein|nr:MAG: hypothetical protein CVU12_10375 [Bacteroidetes bacterium HGW-Bacteroidetes-7]